MKNFTKFLGTAILGLVFSAASFAQGVTANGTATATIVTPLAIAQTTQMSFGNLAVNSSGGTVILTTGNTRTAGGGVSFPPPVGSVLSGVFHVTGVASATYSIVVAPASVDITDGSSNTMSVGTFVTSPTPSGALSAAGAQDILVGATLTVGASQAPGTYTTLPGDEFQITVNYN